MPYTPTYGGETPTVDADFDSWGDELNTSLGEIKADLDGIAAIANGAETTGGAALPKAGGTLTGDVVVADASPTSTRSVGFRGVPVIEIDADRTFGLTDSGKMIRLIGSTSRTWTVPPTGSVGFPIGTVIVLRSVSTGSVTIARGSGVALRVAGSATDGDKTLVSYGQATLVKEDANNWVLSGVGVS